MAKVSSSDKSSTSFRFVPENERWDDRFSWEKRDAHITRPDGSTVFSQKDVEFPEGWSQNSVNIVAQKYFYGDPEIGREGSLRTLIHRVVAVITKWVAESGTLEKFPHLTSESVFEDLCYMIADQRYSFNSPVWFNVGVEAKPQCSACFILSVDDSMESIAENVKTEILIFKGGSGAGSNRGKLRASTERVRGGGVASGPMAFIKIYDAGAGGIKSGGKTRRAAKMEILDSNHLDIEQFVSFKRDEERKAKILIEGGVDGSFCGEAYSTVSGQNANYSVRVDDEFMEMVKADGEYVLQGRHEKTKTRTIRARDLWDLIAQCAWECADPGLQFDGAIQRMHTCANRDKIYATNPCSEYVFLDDTSCNLSSINLRKFLNSDGTFDHEAFHHTAELATIAMDAFIDNASYPTEKIEKGTRTYRTLGLGYTGLGAMLMHLGVPYGSADAQLIAGSITSFMTAAAYQTSGIMADAVGPFADYEHNRTSFSRVMDNHHASASSLAADAYEPGVGFHNAVLGIARPLSVLALDIWSDVAGRAAAGRGFRNAQVSVLAPTGTISFMMGSQDSTGIEPVLGLVTYKNLAGGGVMRQVNPWVGDALENLGYSKSDRDILVSLLEQTGSIFTPTDVEGPRILKPEDYAVFLTSFPDPVTGRSLPWRAHIDMMAACQPFISGAISKTINMPEDSTIEDIQAAYMYAYDVGLKCVAVYRDGSKGVQAIGTSLKTGEKEDITKILAEVNGPAHGERVRLASTRAAITHKFRVKSERTSVKGYMTVGVDESGRPKEVFMTFDKTGGSIHGFMHAWCKSLSFNLQAGIPALELIQAFLHTRFEPYGATDNQDIPTCTSIADYAVKWLMLQFHPAEYQTMVGPRPVKGVSRLVSVTQPVPDDFPEAEEAIVASVPVMHTGTTCSCGAFMTRVGGCEMCPNCGTNTGCGG